MCDAAGCLHQVGAVDIALESGSAVRLGTCCFYFLLPLVLIKPNRPYFALAMDAFNALDAAAAQAGVTVSDMASLITQQCVRPRRVCGRFGCANG